MTWPYGQEAFKTHVAIYCRIDLNKSDMNTKKKHGKKILQTKHLCLIRYTFYPPKGTKHYELLDIGKYNIEIHGGLFLLELGKAVYKPKDKKKDVFHFYIYDIKMLQIGGYWTTV